MRFQSNRSSCGPAALANALEALGIKRSEDELIPLTGQTPDGTDARGILKAIKAISTEAAPLRGDSIKVGEGLAWVLAWFHIAHEGRPMILCVDEEDHWVAATGHLGDRLVVIDSGGNDLVFFYDKKGLLDRWKASDGRYYAIIL